jgi:hypothetical protein
MYPGVVVGSVLGADGAGTVHHRYIIGTFTLMFKTSRQGP